MTGTFWTAGRVALQAIYIVFLARGLHPEEFGIFAAITALGIALSPMVGLGQGLVLVKYVAIDRARFTARWRILLAMCLVSGTTLTVIVTPISAYWFSFSVRGDVITLILVSELLMVPFISASASAYQAHGRVDAAIAIGTALSAVRVLGATALMLAVEGPGLLSYSLIHALGAAVIAAIGLLDVERRWQTGGPRIVQAFHLKEGLLFGTAGFTSLAYSELDKMLLVRLASADIAGLYAVAQRVVGALAAPFGVLILGAAPEMFRRASDTTAVAVSYSMGVLRFTLVIGIVCMMAALALSFAIPYIFGPRYEASVVYVWALCPWVIITGVRQLGSAVLTTIGNQVIRIRIDLLTLVLSVCMNLLLIPQLGAVASIISLTCAELVSATLAWRFIRDIQSSPGNLSTRRHPRS